MVFALCCLGRSVEEVVEECQLGVEAILVALVLHGTSGVPHVSCHGEVVSGVVIAHGLGVGVVVPVVLLALAHDVFDPVDF